MKNSDSSSSIALCLIGMAFVYGGHRLGFGSLSTPGPGFLPIIVGGALSLLSTVLLALTLIRNSSQRKISFWQDKTIWRKVLPALFSLVFYLFLLNPLGYILTTSLFLIFLLKFIGKKGWHSSLLVGIIASVASYFIFKVVLEVRLPEGIMKIG